MNDRVSEELLAEAAGRHAEVAIKDAAGDIDFANLITVEGDHLVTDTRAVAKAFGRAHKNVMRNIDGMRDSKNPIIAQHWRLNFEPRIFEYQTGKGAVRRADGYLMTKDGLAELAMSFTGEKARVTRIRFLAAFNAMARKLQDHGNSLVVQFFETEVQYENEKAKVSASARNMCLWKKKKPEFNGKMDRLRSDIQLKLGFGELPPKKA